MTFQLSDDPTIFFVKTINVFGWIFYRSVKIDLGEYLVKTNRVHLQSGHSKFGSRSPQKSSAAPGDRYRGGKSSLWGHLWANKRVNPRVVSGRSDRPFILGNAKANTLGYAWLCMCVCVCALFRAGWLDKHTMHSTLEAAAAAAAAM